MSIKPKKSPRRGITLMITLMAIVVLATSIAQFQIDAFLSMRASSYRREDLQCRYAAESAIAGASVLIKDIIKTQKASQSEQAGAAASQVSADTVLDSTEPNVLTDPNSMADVSDMLLTSEWSFIIAEQELQIGEAVITIQIHDESAKWPMLWLFRSPFDQSIVEQADPEKMLVRYVEVLRDSDAEEAEYLDNRDELMDTDIETESFSSTMNVDAQKMADDTLALAKKLGKQLDLPIADYLIRKSVRSRTKSQSGGTGYKARWQRKNVQTRIEDQKKRQNQMGLFASRWYKAFGRYPEYHYLSEPLWNRPEAFSDFMGVWGNNRININTASAELIVSVFEPFGMTKEMADSLVQYRQEKPFSQTSEMLQTSDVDEEVLKSIESLCVTTSEQYSIHVTARLGRVTHKLVGGFYFDQKRQIKISAVISGDATRG